MHRSPIHCALAAILAAWFAFVTGEPLALHRCPMHGGTPVAASSKAASHLSHAADGATATAPDAHADHTGGRARVLARSGRVE